MEQPWPGNIRDGKVICDRSPSAKLRHKIEPFVVSEHSPEILPGHISNWAGPSSKVNAQICRQRPVAEGEAGTGFQLFGRCLDRTTSRW